ncbi:SAGA factor-like TAF6 [Rhynchophorus ferrugineus]|uniref:SAGA factor-like TAF6 n=1 Tax=Rhynchophorus ferrugineus TaxID=354439 RepID=UPI003FCCBBA8
MNTSKSSSSGAKIKKQHKVKSKSQSHCSSQKQQDGSNSEKDKGSPAKDYQDYAGIGPDSICLFAEQNSYEDLSKEICNTLTEDINYKLRYIIHNAIVKAKIQGREIITSEDIDEMFSNLKIDKVYGAPTNPNWLAFPDNSLYFLDDLKVSLLDIVEKECSYTQEGDIIIDQIWLPDGSDSEDDMEEHIEQFTHYFQTICEIIVGNNEDLRHQALLDISVNSNIGPVTDWFYNFCYFLLMKETYPDLSLKALELLQVLENSPLSSLHVSGKQLKLLSRIILQRLLGSVVDNIVLRPMCYTLSLMCLRSPLRKTVLDMIKNKIVLQETKLSLLTIIYFLGIDAIYEIFLPHINYFLTEDLKNDQTILSEILLNIYSVICKSFINEHIYVKFYDIYGNSLVPLNISNRTQENVSYKKAYENIPRQHVLVKKHITNTKICLFKTHKKFNYKNVYRKKQSLEDVFEIPHHNCPVKQKIDIHLNTLMVANCEPAKHLTVGKANLPLPVLKMKRRHACIDHSIFGYN